MPLKRFRDIRFFERTEPDVFGNSMPHYAGKLYRLADPWEAVALGARYALKLAEVGFQTEGYHHLYVALSPLLPTGEARIADRQLEPWLVFVDVGLPLDSWPTPAEAQYAALAGAATQALLHLCRVHGYDATMVHEVAAQVLSAGPELEITRLTKETASYALRVSYKVPPHRTPAPVFVEYREKRTGRHGRIEALQLKDFEDVFPLFQSASVTRGRITFKPRDSFRASLRTRAYRVPIQVAVEDVLRGP